MGCSDRNGKRLRNKLQLQGEGEEAKEGRETERKRLSNGGKPADN